jgi:hypothetical protein
VNDRAWVDEETLHVDGVDFVARTYPRFTSTPDRFCLVKPPPLVRRYLQFLEHLRPRRLVELGVFQGGSVALTALVARPDTMLAVELAADRVPALDDLLRSRALTGSVHVHHGVDQGDAARLRALLADVGVTGPVLDLVVDDASHLVGPTRASFETLFPYLRPGGRYVIEDWSWAHVGYGTHLPEEDPLTRLVFELTMVLGTWPGIVADMTLDQHWAVVTRGMAPIADPGSFTLDALLSDRGRRLLAPPR